MLLDEVVRGLDVRELLGLGLDAEDSLWTLDVWHIRVLLIWGNRHLVIVGRCVDTCGILVDQLVVQLVLQRYDSVRLVLLFKEPHHVSIFLGPCLEISTIARLSLLLDRCLDFTRYAGEFGTTYDRGPKVCRNCQELL